MDADKMLAVIKQYKTLLSHIPPDTAGMDNKMPTPREAYAHLHYMLERMESEFLDPALADQESWDKANRWLGFIQGVFWFHGTYTLNQMREHNRS